MSPSHTPGQDSSPDCATTTSPEAATATLIRPNEPVVTPELSVLAPESDSVDADTTLYDMTAVVSPPQRGLRLRGRHIVAAVVTAVVLLGLAAGLYVRSQLIARDAVIAVQQGQIGDLTDATLAFQDELTATRADRDRLSADLTSRTGERDSLASQRDSLTSQLGGAQQKLADTQASLDSANRQLDQARQSGAAQQQRASSADARGNALTAVLKLDGQIHLEYANLLQEVRTMNQAISRYDYFGSAAAYARTQTISDRLSQLFDQRKTALAAL